MSLPRRRRVNFGKKRVFFGSFFYKAKKSNPLPHRKMFHNFYFEEKKIPNYYWLLVILPNSTLSVFNKKQQQKSTKESTNIQKQQKNTFYLIQFVFLDIIQQLFRIYNLLLHKCSPLFSTILLKKSNVLT